MQINSSYIICKNLQFVLMDASSPIDAEAHQHHTWLVYTKADGIRGAIACVPAATLTGLSETIGSGLHGVERVQPIHLNKEIAKEKFKNIFVQKVHIIFLHQLNSLVVSYRSICITAKVIEVILQ